MMAHLPLWYMGEIDPATCDQVLSEIAPLSMGLAAMGADGEVQDIKQRNTAVFFAPFDYWFSPALELHALKANQECKWDYEINQREAIQIAKYEVDQHYGWHVDNFPLAGNLIDRKLTVVCLLNDPSEFEGGELKIRLYNEYTAPLVKGSMIAFPSILEHCVTPVLSGVRYSATMWLTGPKFK